MVSRAFRYIEEENLASAEQLAILDQLMSVPIDEAEELTDDELT